MVRPRLSRPDVVERAGAQAGEGKHNRCANGAYERSELAQSCLAVLAGTGAPATPRRFRTRAADREQEKRGKDGMKAGPRISVRLVGDLCYCSLAVVLPWAVLGRRLEGGCASSGASGWRDKGSVRSAGVGRRLALALLVVFNRRSTYHDYADNLGEIAGRQLAGV